MSYSNDDTALFMIRNSQDELCFKLDHEYSFRLFNNELDDAQKWCQINLAAGAFENLDQAKQKFDSFTSGQEDLLEQRCWFLVSDNKEIGTATSWERELDGELLGLLHWVAIIPEFQGNNLAKPLVAKILNQLNDLYPKTFLKTHLENVIAVKVYKSLGFEPLIRSKADQDLWNQMNQYLAER